MKAHHHHFMHLTNFMHLTIALFFILASTRAFTADQSTAVFHYAFANGSQNWAADFCDYPSGEEEFYELNVAFKKLPAYFGKDHFALFFSGNNHNSDLCMFMRRQITGLKPNTQYRVTFQTTIASNTTLRSFSKDSPAQNVFVKAGATSIKPEAEHSGLRRLNIDKGDQNSEGADAMVLGHIGVGNTFKNKKYMLKTLSSSQPMIVTTNSEGTAWLFFALDSGYEARTSIYVKNFKAIFTQTQPWKLSELSAGKRL